MKDDLPVVPSDLVERLGKATVASCDCDHEASASPCLVAHKPDCTYRLLGHAKARIEAQQAKIAAQDALISQLVEALDETCRRYPDAVNALAWFRAASGLGAGEITDEHRAWAASQHKDSPNVSE